MQRQLTDLFEAKSCSIIGLGLIGSSIGLKLRELGWHVVGFGQSRPAQDLALAGKVVTEVSNSVTEAVKGSELVIVATPVGSLDSMVAKVLAVASPQTTVTDVGSLMLTVVDHCNDDRYIAGHPLAGSQMTGGQAARADLFQGAVWYLSDAKGKQPLLTSDGSLHLQRVVELVQRLGGNPVAISAERHDQLMTVVSQLPHVVANTLVETLVQWSKQTETQVNLGPSWLSVTRVAGANPRLWGEIYALNSNRICGELESLIEFLQSAKERIARADADELVKWQENISNSQERLNNLNKEMGK